MASQDFLLKPRFNFSACLQLLYCGKECEIVQLNSLDFWKPILSVLIKFILHICSSFYNTSVTLNDLLYADVLLRNCLFTHFTYCDYRFHMLPCLWFCLLLHINNCRFCACYLTQAVVCWMRFCHKTRWLTGDTLAESWIPPKKTCCSSMDNLTDSINVCCMTSCSLFLWFQIPCWFFLIVA